MKEMDQAARGWMLNTARANYWRVKGWCEFEDLIQDGHVCYYRVVAKYAERQNRVRPPKLIMALFKTTYTNHLHAIAKHRMYCPATFAEFRDLPENSFDASLQYCERAEMDVLIAEAPAVVGLTLKALLTDGNGKKLRSRYRVTKNHRETFNERLCRLVGLDPTQFNLSEMTRNYLNGLA